MTKIKAVFLDRDGVINEDKGYVHKIEDFKFIPQSIEGLQVLSNTDYKLIIITNQSGIGKDYYSEDDYHKLTDYMLKKLVEEGIRIEKVYFCPHDPDSNCECRKPKIKMIKQAEGDWDIDLNGSWVIGDKTSDIRMGEDAGCRTILVRTGKGGNDKKCDIRPDYVAEDLYEAALIIKDKQNEEIC